MTEEQFYVCFESGTEPPFDNAYWNNYAPGLYKSLATGVPLFSSKDKYKSGTGWPTFSKPLPGAPVLERTDTSYGMTRIEAVCSEDWVHLGHVFDDGPKDDGGKRWCLNSAALDFIKEQDLTPEEKDKFGPF